MKKRFGLIIDQERCIGCDACTVACQIENKTSQRLIHVQTQNTLQKDTPAGRFPNLAMHFLPLLCNHCEHPPCVDACPLEAIEKNDEGPVILNEDACDACQICIEACPYEAIHFNRKQNAVQKCNLCIHRIEQGLEPFCVMCCEGQAMHFGDLNDSTSEASIILSQKTFFQLMPESKTGPSIFYCPPKAPRGL